MAQEEDLEIDKNPYRSPNGEPSLPGRRPRRQLVPPVLLASFVPPLFFLSVAIMYDIAGVRPPEPLVAIPLLVIILACPVLLIVGVYRLFAGKGSVIAAWLYVILGIAYLLLAAMVTIA